MEMTADFQNIECMKTQMQHKYCSTKHCNTKHCNTIHCTEQKTATQKQRNSQLSPADDVAASAIDAVRPLVRAICTLQHIILVLGRAMRLSLLAA